MMEETAVYLNEYDAKLFLEFQKRYAFVKALEEIGAFDIRSGSVTIHFDNVGQIVNMDKRQVYRV